MFSGSSLALLILDSFLYFDLPMILTNIDKGHAFFIPSKSSFFLLSQEHLISTVDDKFCSLGILSFQFEVV